MTNLNGIESKTFDVKKFVENMELIRKVIHENITNSNSKYKTLVNSY